MAPKACKIKSQPSKLAKLHNAKKQKKLPHPTRPAPSRGYPTCDCLQYEGYEVPGWVYDAENNVWSGNFIKTRYAPCDCERTIPDVAVKPATIRRNPGRMDGVTWNGSNFLCAAHVDGDPISERCSLDGSFGEDEDDEDDLWEEESIINTSHTVLLLDIARPAKSKGAAKHFEIIHTPARVVALEDDEFESHSDGDFDDDDWEDLYLEERAYRRERDAYSAILKKRLSS